MDHMKYTDHQHHHDFYAKNIQFERQKKKKREIHRCVCSLGIWNLVVLIQQWVERVNESKRQVSIELRSWTTRLF